MKYCFSIIFLFLSLVSSVSAQGIAERLAGRILLQVEERGEAYYVYPSDKKRYYLGRPGDAFRIMKSLGLGISELDYKRYEKKAPAKLGGMIVLRAQANGEAYYINKADLKMYYLGRPYDAWQMMRQFALGIKNSLLAEIASDNYLGLNLVQRVVDGDTIDVLINNKKERIRIIGIDTPESVIPGQSPECYGKEASQRAREILLNKYVRLEADSSQDNRDKYGRLLRHIFVDSKNFATVMLGEGYAREYTYRIPSKYTSIYQEAEKNAKEAKFGLWADGACLNSGQGEVDFDLPIDQDSQLEISYLFYNGRLNPGEADEYVEIKNNAESSINLENYQLRDASGKVFIFPEIILGVKKKILIYTGCGINSSSELYWCHEQGAIWNNNGDRAELINPQQEIAASYNY